MKKILNLSGIFGIVTSVAMLQFILSCDKGTTSDDPESYQYISITGEHTNIPTKTTLSGLTTSWVASSDKVGIYCSQATGGTNAEYTAASSASSSVFTGNMKWGSGNHNFYAYYPYNSGYSGAATAVPISLSSSQTQSAGNSSSHIGALDFLVATPSLNVTPGTSGESTNVGLTYNHVFSVLEFKFYSSTFTGKITKVRLTAPDGNLSLTSGTIDITQASPAAGSSYTISSAVGTSEITLTITEGATVGTTSGNTESIYMMILPGDFSSKTMTIGLEFDNQGYYTNYTKTGKSFERGKKIVVAIDLDSANPWGSFSSVTINHEAGTFNGVTATTGNITWAPVNVGYDANHKYGLLFQWGRKFGQISRASETRTDGLSSVDQDLGSTRISLSTGNLYSNRNIFYYTSATIKDWCTPSQSTWPSSNNPCPPGWRLPTRADLAALGLIYRGWTNGSPTAVGEKFDGLDGVWFGQGTSFQVFLPGGGDRIDDGSFIESGDHSDIWSSGDYGGDSFKAYCFDNYRPGNTLGGGANAKPNAFDSDNKIRGSSVRCVKVVP